MMRMVERKTTIFCSCHLFVRGWAVLLHKLGTFLGKDEVAGSNPAISSIYGTPKQIFGVPFCIRKTRDSRVVEKRFTDES